ncbi:hypothetical protein GXW83_24560 [Streptacidiphilus sp. PB12-B1b]|uniref:WXG100-like domain-containing protein n=1 Tax=Streptacidiphilus sp. PB12-B1b TaxID=2705012 RepID=UPI0015FD799F|nr:hypothetical protein [Streptacidiphilus sp. PB12-B1b]QMU78404.1 hypothetical protein GXW83_24560 [Streptacidiphilus sp. PB12-B1b]
MSSPAVAGAQPIDVSPEDLQSVALTFAGGQSTIDSIAGTLSSALQAAAGMAGDDKYGKQFAAQYDPAAKALFVTLSACVRAVGQASTGLSTTANNYLKADGHSNAAAGSAGPRLYSLPFVITDVMYPVPLTAVGGGSNHWPPPIDKYWPDGHQDRLRAAASAFRTAATGLDNAARDMDAGVQSLTDNNSSASVNAMAAFWGKIWSYCDAGGAAPLSSAYLACTQLAKYCDDFAGAIDNAHSEFEHKLAEAGISLGLTTALGAIGTLFTGGGSDAGALGFDAAEAAGIFGSVETILDVALSNLAAEGIAALEAMLSAAADGVPEIEAVDAETTQVSTTLDSEMSQTESRELASVAGRGGGTGGGGGTPAGFGGADAGVLGPDGMIDSDAIDDLTADDILKDNGSVLGKNSGRKMPVRTVRSVDDLDAIWSKLTDDAPQPGPGQKLASYLRSDGTRIQYRITSSSGGETIDIDATSANGKTWKIHLPKG